jgi:hypothetical protein
MRFRWSAPALVIALAACGSDEPTAPTFAQAMCIRGTIAIGQTVNGTLATSDCDEGSSYFESYRLNVAADTTIDISMSSGAFDTFLLLLRIEAENVESLTLVEFNDDIEPGVNTNSLIAGVALAATEDYLVIANGFDETDVGAYTLTIVP